MLSKLGLLAIATLFIVTATVTTTAQSSETSRTWIGARFGYGASTHAEASEANERITAGPAWNVALCALFNNGDFASFGLQPEIHYTSESIDRVVDDQGNETQLNGSLRYNSIRIPVLLKFSLGDPELIQPSIFAGPYANILLNGQAKFGSFETDIDNLNGVAFGASFGADVRLFRNLMVDLRYNLGLSDYVDAPSVNGSPIFTSKMSSVILSVGVMFN